MGILIRQRQHGSVFSHITCELQFTASKQCDFSCCMPLQDGVCLPANPQWPLCLEDKKCKLYFKAEGFFIIYEVHCLGFKFSGSLNPPVGFILDNLRQYKHQNVSIFFTNPPRCLHKDHRWRKIRNTSSQLGQTKPASPLLPVCHLCFFFKRLVWKAGHGSCQARSPRRSWRWHLFQGRLRQCVKKVFSWLLSTPIAVFVGEGSGGGSAADTNWIGGMSG